MIRFSIWSDMPRPCRPPIALASMTRSTGDGELRAVDRTGRPRSKPIVTSSGAISTAGSQNLTPMIGSTISIPLRRCSRFLASCVAPQMFASVE